MIAHVKSKGKNTLKRQSKQQNQTQKWHGYCTLYDSNCKKFWKSFSYRNSEKAISDCRYSGRWRKGWKREAKEYLSMVKLFCLILNLDTRHHSFVQSHNVLQQKNFKVWKNFKYIQEVEGSLKMTQAVIKQSNFITLVWNNVTEKAEEKDFVGSNSENELGLQD